MNREDWLERLARMVEPWFAQHGYSLSPYRIAIGFPSTGKRGRRIGEVWDGRCSADGTFEILIRPDQDDPVSVAGVLIHEMVHVAVGLDAKHGSDFRALAVKLGLVGKMTATSVGAQLERRLRPLLGEIGPLPHARLGFGQSSGPKKQKARLLKAECDVCGYVVRIARKWVDDVGPPHCPIHGSMAVELGGDDEPNDQYDIEELIARGV